MKILKNDGKTSNIEVLGDEFSNLMTILCRNLADFRLSHYVFEFISDYYHYTWYQIKLFSGISP